MTPGTIHRKNKWVRESAFGVWFLGTGTWATHVLNRALDDLEKLMSPGHDHYPVIVDIGYGHGHSLVMLDQRFRPDRIIAIDIDPEASKRSTANVSQCHSRIDMIRGNADAIALQDASVDMIFCHQTFHHLVDQDSAMREFYRVLKPGGVLLFAESCRRYIHSFIIRLLFRHPMDVQKTDIEYIELIRSAGFIINDDAVSRPYLWWSRSDLGILEKLKIKRPAADREETMINLVAYRP